MRNFREATPPHELRQPLQERVGNRALDPGGVRRERAHHLPGPPSSSPDPSAPRDTLPMEPVYPHMDPPARAI